MSMLSDEASRACIALLGGGEKRGAFEVEKVIEARGLIQERRHDVPGQRVVCAAMRLPGTEKVIASPRHWDDVARAQVRVLPPLDHATWRDHAEQGFIDQRGQFMNRQQAWLVAVAAGQILRRVGGDSANGGTLYSENIY